MIELLFPWLLVTSGKKIQNSSHGFVTFNNCLHLPRLLAHILARLPLLDLQPSFLHVLFIKLWNFSIWQPFFLAGRECTMPFSWSCSSTTFCSKLTSFWPTPPLLQQFPSHSPHPRLLCTSCSWFYIWWYIQSILCSCLFSLCASFFFSELPVSWDEGLGLLFPVGLRYQEWSWLKVGKIGPHYFKSRWKNRSREDPCQDCTGQGQMSEAG